MHNRSDSATLSQLAFPGESSPNFPWENSHWDNTVVRTKQTKRQTKTQLYLFVGNDGYTLTGSRRILALVLSGPVFLAEATALLKAWSTFPVPAQFFSSRLRTITVQTKSWGSVGRLHFSNSRLTALRAPGCQG